MSILAYIPRAVLGAAAFAAFLAFSAPAQAALSCTFTISAMNFGTVDLTANSTFDTTATFSANCSGGTANANVRICPNINNGTGGASGSGTIRTALSGSNQLQYNLYQNSSRTTIWGSYLWSWPSVTPPTINITLNSSGAGSTTATIYGRVFASQTGLPPGTYTSTFSGTHTQIAYQQTSTNNCATIGSTNAQSASFTVTVTYTAICNVATTTIDFGTKGVLSTVTDATGTVTATCSSTTPYTIALNNGSSGSSNPAARLMINGTKQITYSIYRDSARTLVWGSTTGTNTVSGTGNGSGQAITAYGRVPVQTTPAPATYTDTVIATVTY